MQSHPAAPAWALFLSEPARATAGLGAFVASAPLLPALPRGDGHPVLVLPGLLTEDSSTLLLRLVLRRLGYRVRGWGLGRNVGPTARAVTGMQRSLEELASVGDGPVTLIGWSLGGIFARNLARRSPGLVRQVIALGSPFRLASADQSRVSGAFERFSHLHVEPTVLPLERDAHALTVPATSIYSRFDGIVSWRACLDLPAPRTENVEVFSSHLGFSHNPSVLYAVADRLAQPAGTWRAFRAPRYLAAWYPAPGRRGRRHRNHAGPGGQHAA